MLLQLLGISAPATPPSGPLQQPILTHYALILAIIPSGFLGSTFAFRFLSRAPGIATSRLLLLGALFAVVSYASFIAALSIIGGIGGLVWLWLLAVGIAFAGSAWPWREAGRG